VSTAGTAEAEAPPASEKVRPAAPKAGIVAFATLFRFEACFTRDIVAPPYLWERFDSSRCNITLGDRAAQATNALFRIQFLFILMNDIDVIYAMLPQADLRVATASRKQTRQVQCICGVQCKRIA
jgi:hypothetical protein